ncbi:PAS domain S-box-containing protein [Methanocalculus sp. AMF5]|uniref:PAS domain S-box protein n=2 Tax=unclassified Methanocalculus TaxID=2631035 RepID=UPI0020A1E727|nr:PAS domain S-box protein [Methanocalculus sp. AMF5]MCP1661459.1 PAS domain S-box-containing protein [Methanocalculus sp. AMF5]
MDDALGENNREKRTLPEREQMLSDIISFLPDPTFAIDEHGVVLAWNHAIEELTGVPADEMVGQGDYAYALPFYGERRPILIDLAFTDANELRSRYTILKEMPDIIEAETRYARLNGEERILWVRVSPLYNKEGEYTGAIETIRDVTERRQREEALERSEHLQTLILAAVPDILIRCDAEGRYLDILTPDDERLAYPKADLIGKTVTEVTTDEVGSRLVEAILTSLATKELVTIEYMLPVPAGRLHFEARIAPYADDEVIALIRDITDRKEAEARLRLHLRRAEALLSLHRMTDVTEQDLMDATLDAALATTESSYGFIGMLSADGSDLIIHAWSEEVKDECAVEDQPVRFPVESAGIWGEPVRTRLPVLINDYAAPHPAKHGLPEGHVPISRYMSVPILLGEEIFAVLAVANKREDYLDDDLSALTTLGIMMSELIHRMRSEDSLRESRERYRLLVENQQDLIVKTDTEGRFLYVNPAYARLFGKTEDELLGSSYAPFIHPDDRKRVNAALARLFKPPYETSFEERAETRYGWRWIAWTAKAIRDSDGVVIALVGAGRDITGQKEAEEALLLKHATIESSINGIAIASLSGIITYVNPAFLTLWGYEDPDEVIGQHVVMFWRSEEEAAGLVDDLKRHGHFTGEMEGIRKDGTMVYIQLSSSLVRDVTGSPVAMMGSFIDITEEKTARLELEINHYRLEGAMEMGELAWWEMDCESGAVSFSERKALMLGYKPEDFTHYTDFTTLLHPDDYESAMQAMRDHLEGRKPRYDVEYRIRTADGDYLWFRDVGGIPERNPDGTPLKVVGLVANITRRKHDEAQLRESEELYRTLFEDALNPILVVSEDGYYTDANEAALAFLECSRDELITKSVWDTTPPDQLARQKQEHSPFIATRTVETEYLVHGTIKTLLLNVVPLEVQGKTVLYGIGQDITDRKMAEKALRESEERFKTLFMESPVSIIIHDRDSGEIIDANTKACSSYGLSSVEELKAHDFWVESPHSFEDALNYIRKAATEGPQEFEWVNRSVGGDIFWEYVRLMKVVIGGVERIQAVAIDITKRKQAEEELRKNEELLRTAGEVALFGGWEVLPDENRVIWSDEVARIHDEEPGYSPSTEEAISYYAPEWRERVREVFSACITDGTPFDEEMEIITKSGRRKWVRTIGEAVRDASGENRWIRGAIQDITTKKEAEEAWKKAYARLEDNMYRFSLLNDEIRNPLAVIMGLVDLEQGEYTDQIIKEIQKIDRIITLLDQGMLESDATRAFMKRYGQIDG